MPRVPVGSTPGSAPAGGPPGSSPAPEDLQVPAEWVGGIWSPDQTPGAPRGPRTEAWVRGGGGPGEGAGHGGRYQVPVVVHGQAEAVPPLRLLPVVLLDAPQVLLPDLPASGLSLLLWAAAGSGMSLRTGGHGVGWVHVGGSR